MELKVDKKDKNLTEVIVSAIAFFDMFDFPLTDFEIWKYVSVKCKLSEVQQILSHMSLRGAQATKQSQLGGKNEIASPSRLADAPAKRAARKDSKLIIEKEKCFYFSRGRSEIIKTRLKRYIYADRKFKRALRIAKIFKFIPWIKMIAVSNVIGAHNLKDESDIDIFIITKAKKIWLTRFFCSSIAQILGLRPKKDDTRDKVCLNFYVSEEAMDLRPLFLPDFSQSSKTENSAKAERKINKDIYFIYWLVELVPIYGNYDTYKKFIQSNSWIKDYFPNWQPVKIVNRRFINESSSILKNIINILFGGFEKLFKKIQLKKLPNSLKDLMNKDTRVVINDKVLKMHVNDRRREYGRMWGDKTRKIMS